MPEETRIYTIPLRDVKRVPRTKRAPKAIKVIRDYMVRHMKVDPDDLMIDPRVNEKIWERGIQNPPPTGPSVAAASSARMWVSSVMNQAIRRRPRSG